MRRLAGLCGTLILVALAVVLLARGASSPEAAAEAASQPPIVGDSFESVLGQSAGGIVLLGSSSQQPSQTWAYGTIGSIPTTVNRTSYSNQVVLLQHTESSPGEDSGWQVVPLPTTPGGEVLSSGGSGTLPYSLDDLGGRVTPAGGVVLLTGGGILARDPGGKMKLVPSPGEADAAGELEPSELLGTGESLPPQGGAAGGSGTAYAATDEAEGHTGILIAPYGDGAGAEASEGAIPGPGVLHYDGSGWTREAIAWEGEKQQEFTPQALACAGEEGGSAPPNCWLLASYRESITGNGRLALFRRTAAKESSAGYAWERVNVADWLLGGAAPPPGVSGSSVSTLGATAQTLTVTSQGVWVDFQAKIGSSTTAVDFSELVLAPGKAGEEAAVAGHWCFGGTAPGCQSSLEVSLPSRYTSVATAGGSASELGTRVISGMPDGGLLELYGNAFHLEAGPGGEVGGAYGAAFGSIASSAPKVGWLGQGGSSTYDHQGAAPLVHLTPHPQGDQLHEQPVPFRHPLLAVTQAPGTTPGDPNAAAIAVGAEGEIGRYTPGEGWSAESLYNSSGEAQRPTLRGVAWPEPNLAYAVGDDGAMWVWRAETGLWKPDPSAPYNFVGNLTGIAFDPGKPQLGYAVGKQGVLLSYNKTWEPISATERQHLEAELKIEELQLNFTSVAFAGGQALATYRYVDTVGEPVEGGGMLINEENGTGWHVDFSAASLLAQLPVRATILSKVAGLPDGGAVAAGPGLVIERESAGAPWQFSPQPLAEAQNVSALAAFREPGGGVRAMISIEMDSFLNPNGQDIETNSFGKCDLPPPTGPGQPPAHLCPDPLPSTGYLLRQAAGGWEDMEHMAFEETTGGEPKDEPAHPDPVLAVLASSDGSQALAVGGQTGDFNGTGPSANFETSAAMRFGGGATSDGGSDAGAPVVTSPGVATFAVGGEAACEHACASFAGEDIAPDVLLSHALQSANQIASTSPGGLRAFLYTGGRLRQGLSSLSPESAARELARYSELLGSGGPLPVYAAASPDMLAAGSAGISSFTTALSQFLPGVQPGASSAYYSCPSAACPANPAGAPVKVIVLDFSSSMLGIAQEHWLEGELRAARSAKMPAIVVGNASLGFALPEAEEFNPGPVKALDASAVQGILCKGEASAYLFDYPGVNLQTQVACGSRNLTEIGTGALGYSSAPAAGQTDSLSSSGFLLLEVDAGQREPGTEDVAPVHVRVEPVIDQLAIEADNGTLLRRSHAALFEGLARIPTAGTSVSVPPNGRVQVYGPEPYEPIPFDCLGSNCTDQVPAEYSFSSSDPEVGAFVVHEAGAHSPEQVQLSANQKPIPDEARTRGGQLIAGGRFAENAKGEPVNENGEVVPAEQSGLFCALNPGTTVVSITTGGLTYSMPVTVQGGSAEYPCGTVPVKNLPQPETAESTSIPLIKPEAPLGAAPFVPAIHLAVPHAPVPPPHARPRPKPHHAPGLPLVPPVASLAQLRPAILPPPPPAARPSPPGGTSSAQVTQSAYAPQKEREEEAATDLVHNFAAYESPLDVHGYLYGLPLLLLLLAFGSVKLHRIYRPEKPRLARQTVRRS